MLCLFAEEDFLLSQAALLEQVSNLQPLLDSTYIRGEFQFVGHIKIQQNNVCFVF